MLTGGAIRNRRGQQVPFAQPLTRGARHRGGDPGVGIERQVGPVLFSGAERNQDDGRLAAKVDGCAARQLPH